MTSEQLGVQGDDDGTEPDDDEHLGEGRSSVGNFGFSVVVAAAALKHRCHEGAQNQRTPQVPLLERKIAFEIYFKEEKVIKMLESLNALK